MMFPFLVLVLPSDRRAWVRPVVTKLLTGTVKS